MGQKAIERLLRDTSSKKEQEVENTQAIRTSIKDALEKELEINLGKNDNEEERREAAQEQRDRAEASDSATSDAELSGHGETSED